MIKREMRDKEKNKATNIERTKVDNKSINEEQISFKNIDIKEKSTKNTRKNKVDKNIINEDNIFKFHCGSNYRAQEMLGAHIVTENNIKGVRFTTWAPNAKNIYVVGDFNDFQIDSKYLLSTISQYGLWSIFVPNLSEGLKYKFAIETREGKILYKCDPYAFQSELRPANASIIHDSKRFKWEDTTWVTKRKRKNKFNNPMNIYEIHLGSWRTKDNRFMTFDEIREVLPSYIKEMGYTHVEIMPLVEHPLDASWGYQGTGYFSVTSRYGDMEGFKRLVNDLHKNDIGVIIDWVPGHFCKDAHGLYKFDGTPTYEYQEEWRADNKDWGTYNFDLGRSEVKSFLISNALFWLEEFHLDGIRVDAVSNILYRDYGKKDGEWKPNKYGGNGNLEGIEFLRELNKIIKNECKNVMMIAEESTAWPNVCKEEGLGFDYKWNMGWMNDVLEYVQIDTMFRKQHHGKLNFSMMYAYSENYILPISHDEIVHGKKALVEKMFGDDWNKFAGTRVFLSYMMGHPGKKLSFMGTELGQRIEWREYEELEWNLIEELKFHKGLHEYVKDLNKFYKDNKAMWELDCSPEGFEWIDPDNDTQSILSFIRKGKRKDDILIFVCNFKSEVYYDFKIGVPYLRDYVEVFNSDDEKYGGSGQVMGNVKLVAEKGKQHNQDYHISIKVPPMGTVVLALDKGRKR